MDGLQGGVGKTMGGWEGGGRFRSIKETGQSEIKKKESTSVFVFQCAQSKLQLKAIHIPVKNVPTI